MDHMLYDHELDAVPAGSLAPVSDQKKFAKGKTVADRIPGQFEAWVTNLSGWKLASFAVLAGIVLSSPLIVLCTRPRLLGVEVVSVMMMMGLVSWRCRCLPGFVVIKICEFTDQCILKTSRFHVAVLTIFLSLDIILFLFIWDKNLAKDAYLVMPAAASIWAFRLFGALKRKKGFNPAVLEMARYVTYVVFYNVILLGCVAIPYGLITGEIVGMAVWGMFSFFALMTLICCSLLSWWVVR